MGKSTYKVTSQREYLKAGPNDLIELKPVPGQNPLFVVKDRLEDVVCGIMHHEMVHVSGPTGTAKTSLIEAVCLVPENFLPVSRKLGDERECLPKLYPIEMAIFESPGELYQRRALGAGPVTFDEPSVLVQALVEAERDRNHHPVIWLRELGRVHSASVQGGLPDLMQKGPITLPGRRRIDGSRISWIADSNYQAQAEATHTLVEFDDVLKRRFTINVCLDYLSPEKELVILQNLMGGSDRRLNGIDRDTINKLVRVGRAIREQKAEGNLQSIPPPTIYGYLSFLRMHAVMPSRSLQEVAASTFLGNGDRGDQELLKSVFNQAFGVQDVEDWEDGGGTKI